jgi:virulence-associated protein VagC
MNTLAVSAEVLNLPQRIADKFKGMEIEIIENQSSIIIKPLEDDIDDAINELCGIFRGDGHEVDRFMEAKQSEIDLEDEIDRAFGMFQSDGHAVDRFMEEKQREIDIEEEFDARLWNFSKKGS